jgi:hypothetical protein
MPQQGEVGGGHQNDWKPEGTIYEKHPKLSSYPVAFKKGNVTKNTTRNDNECWTAGTPVVWGDDEDPSQAKTITAEVGGISDMLVSRDPVTQKVTEYHPLITFFNEIIARIMRDGHRDWLSGLEKEKNAINLWQYLDEKYLKHPEKVEANGSPKKIEVV